MSARAVNTPPNPSTFETYVSCKDHLVSGEKFDLLLDDSHHKHMISNLAMSQILEEIKY